MIKYHYLVSFLFALIFFRCASMNQYDTCKQKLSISLSEADFITTVPNSKQKTTLKLYGIEVRNGVYSELMVCKPGKENEVIYYIKETNFFNPCGKENIPINDVDFFGYRILIVKDGYFEIQPFWDIEAKISGSDSIVIKWNDDKKVFEILFNP